MENDLMNIREEDNNKSSTEVTAVYGDNVSVDTEKNEKDEKDKKDKKSIVD